MTKPIQSIEDRKSGWTAESPMKFASLTCACLVAAATSLAQAAVKDYVRKPDAWFSGPEAAQVGAHILSWQSDLGGWPKNVDTAGAPYRGKDRAKDLKPTFDNGATTDELRILARLFTATQDTRFKDAFLRGLDYIHQAQYPSGGWPQFHPPGKEYHRHITFNDNAMVRLMEFERELTASPRYSFLDEKRRSQARQSFDRGIACILRCQVKVDGRLTAWCAQHDETDFSPRPARTFELVSLSGSESVGIVRLLMGLERPDAQVAAAIESAVAWFESAKLTGIRLEEKKDQAGPKGGDLVVVQDSAAPPIWARFYEIGTNRPMFASRDGVVKYQLSEISAERRNNYGWYGTWPAQLLAKEYPAWRAKQRSAVSADH